MDKYEYRVKTEQLLEYAEKKQYQKAMEIADTIDWRRVKNASMLNTVSEVYEYCGEYQKSRDILFVAYDRAPESRKVVYRLGTLALKIGDTDEAADCYEEFVKVAPKDPNQYILKYKILKAQHSPLSEQITTLEEFKKAEYIEKWAYELAKLYHEAGMTKECLEECDDLILWFSEGKYVQMAMELKMKYKPLTPLQQEKYEGNLKGPAISEEETSEEKEDKDEEEEKEDEEEGEEKKDEEKEDDEKKGKEKKEKKKEKAGAAKDALNKKKITQTGDTGEILTASDIVKAVTSKLSQVKLGPDLEEVQEDDEHSDEDEAPLTEEEIVETVRHETEHMQKPGSSIVKQVVTGATLEEALKSTVTLLNKEEKDMAAKDEQLRISGQMKIDDILAEWEEKQKGHAEAIKKQKEIDKERLQKEREEAQKRIEAGRLAAEEAARKAAEEAARKAAEEEAARKAAEEEAARKAAEEAARKAAAEEAARKAAEEEAARKAAAEEAARKAAEEEAARKAAEEEAARKATEEEAARKAAEEEVLRVSEESMRQEAKKKAAKKKAEKETGEADRQISGSDGFSGENTGNVPTGKTQRLPDDIMELVEQLESRVASTKVPLRQVLDGEESEEDTEEDFEDLDEEFTIEGDRSEERALEEDFIEADDIGESFEKDIEEDFEEDFEEEDPEEEDFEEEDFEVDTEDGFIEDAGAGSLEDSLFEEDSAEEDFEEDFLGEDFGEEDFEEEDFEREALEDDFEEEDFEEEDFEEEDFEEDDFEEEDFEEEDFEEDFEEEDFEEEDFEEEDFEEDGFAEEDFEEEALSEEDFEEGIALEEVSEDESEEIPLEIEEPSEEEIQKRIKKAKSSGVPFDTGFVVTGRYDLSATSEIGLKAGLTEDQKKLFSYFVPVRGMSEQIVEVLDNDRRARREGTSCTGNILVIGRKGSGKTVLAVDIVKAIQKQRNLKQGKVAIVTGDSLNKKELANIIQKLRGGAIIVEKAGKLNTRTVKELNHLMERKTGEMLFVLEDQRKPLERMLTANPEFRKKFTSKLELPVFINDELVTFGQTYAKENGYKLDEMGILALYSRIDVMQREDHAVSVAEVKDIMDEAIAHSQKANVKHLARRVFGKGTDESDRIILKEEDFRV